MSTRRANELLYDSEATLRLVDSVLEELRDFPSPGGASSSRDDATATEQAAAPDTFAEATRRAHAELSTTVERLGQSRAMLESSASRRPSESSGTASDAGHDASAVLDSLDGAMLLLDRMDEEDSKRGATLRHALRHQLYACMSRVQLEDITAQQLEHASRLLAGMEQRLARISDMLDPERFGLEAPLPGLVPAPLRRRHVE